MISLRHIATLLLLVLPSLQTLLAAPSNLPDDSLDISDVRELDGVVVATRRPSTTNLSGAVNGLMVSREELFRAACCNLGESFTTNASVDVNYNDATTGAREIRLLGLSGTYVQMLTENLPNFRGLAMPYALGYVPGPWMKSIQVSKGVASVRNGFEAMTGQINVQYLQPEDDEGVTVNLFGDTKSRMEGNADANIHLNSRLSTELLLHYENRWGHHDGNHDGFLDQPKNEQYNVQNRWAYLGGRYIFHGGLSLLYEQRNGGQSLPQPKPPSVSPRGREGSGMFSNREVTTPLPPSGGDRGGLGLGEDPGRDSVPLWRSSLKTNRYEGYMKHAFVLDKAHGTNIALMGTASLHKLDARYGRKAYDADQKNLYAQLMFETHFTDRHELSAGLSFDGDWWAESGEWRVESGESAGASKSNHNSTLYTLHSSPLPLEGSGETVWGAYAQYTYTLGERLIAMAGIRADHSNAYGTFVTPRLHLKWQPADIISVRLSAGKGYRSPHPIGENSYLLATGRTLVADSPQQEAAWNYGASTALYIPIAGKTLRLNVEYFYTDFLRQTIVDYDTDAAVIRLANLNGRSYSHTLQADATYTPFSGMMLTAAYRRNIVRCTYGGVRLDKPLSPHYRALVSTSYKTPRELWQFDATLQLTGKQRIPQAATYSHPYAGLSAQVTRWFRHFSVYIGGENLTGYRQPNPIIGYEDPWSTGFEPTLVWGPVHGATIYAGIRINFGRL